MSKSDDFDDDIEVDEEFAFDEPSSLLERKELSSW